MNLLSSLIANVAQTAVDAVKLTAAIGADVVVAPFNVLMDEPTFERTIEQCERIKEELDG